MYLFSSKKGAAGPVRARVPVRPSSQTAGAGPETFQSSWMDSSVELKQGLDVVELDELPPELFKQNSPASR